MTGLDLSDPLVRRMAELNHEPEEMWSSAGGASVWCRTCRLPCRCPTRLALDEMEPDR